jgi:hypothetical protein
MKLSNLKKFIPYSICFLLTSCGSSGIGWGGMIALIILCGLLCWGASAISNTHIEWQVGTKKIYEKWLIKYWEICDKLISKLEKNNNGFSSEITTKTYRTYSLIICFIGCVLFFIGTLTLNLGWLAFIGVLLLLMGICSLEIIINIENEGMPEEHRHISRTRFFTNAISDVLLLFAIIIIILVLIGIAIGNENSKSNTHSSNSDSNRPAPLPNTVKENKPYNMPNYSIHYRYPSGSAIISNSCTMYSDHIPTISEAKAFIRKSGWGTNHDQLEIYCILKGVNLNPNITENHSDNLLR